MSKYEIYFFHKDISQKINCYWEIFIKNFSLTFTTGRYKL